MTNRRHHVQRFRTQAARLTITVMAYLFCLAGAFAAPAMAASPIVFHSPTLDGNDPGTTWNLENTTGTLDLWLAPGPNTSAIGEGEQVCLNGSGDEICGFTIAFATIGSMQMITFTEEASSHLVFNFDPPSSLRINRVNSEFGDEYPVRIGQLIVSVEPGTGHLVVTDESEAVAANLELVEVDSHTPIAAPEPGALASLVAGTSLLSLLARRRLRRGAMTTLAAAAFTVAGGTASAVDTIDFETGYANGDSVSTINTLTNAVTISGNSTIRVVKVGAPVAAFEPDDTSTWPANFSSYFISDTTGQGPAGIRDRYGFEFEKPVGGVSMYLFDYRPEGVPPHQVKLGDIATLRAYRDVARTQLVAETKVELDGLTPTPDGHVIELSVSGVTAEIRAATVTLTGPDVTTGIDSIKFQTVVDSDFDDVYDPFDNCPDLYNASQTDTDNDGYGDYCDNCNLYANAGQNDSDQNGIGDACDPPNLFIVNEGDQNAPIYDVYLECNATPISEVNFGLMVPFGSDPLEAVFAGDNCGAPPIPPPGISAGPGCVANPGLGTNVDPSLSGYWDAQTGAAPPYHQRAVYAKVVGNGVDQRLCDPFESPVFLGRLRVEPTPLFLGDGAFVFDGIPDQGTAILTSAAAPYEGTVETTTLSIVAVPPPAPALELLVQPAAGETTATAQSWSLCLGSDTAQRMHRIAVGFHVEGSTYADIRVEGCDTEEDGEGKRECDTHVGDDVDKDLSYTIGPFPTDQPPFGAETMYVVLQGDAFGGALTTLNSSPYTEKCLATITIDSPPGTPGISASLVTDGTEGLVYETAPDGPWVKTVDASFIDLSEVALVNGYSPGEDFDKDGHLDSADNCVFRANDLDNNGDFLSATPDFDDDGDECECADANNSGATFASETPDPFEGATPDLLRIRQHLVGLDTDPGIAQVCSVFESPDCNTQDAVVLQRALAGLQPTIEQRCDAALPD